MDDALRGELVRYVRRKFAGTANVQLFAEDIVQEAITRFLHSPSYALEKANFGYLSVSCLRLAYRQFRSKQTDHLCLEHTGDALIDDTDIAHELAKSEDATLVLRSLDTLNQIQRIVIQQRYYGDFSFTEIAEKNGLKLNTVLSHHRRALQKLRPHLTQLLGYGKEIEDE